MMDLTNSTSMGAILSKSQENVSGVEDQESVLENFVNGGVGGAGLKGGLNVLDEFSTARNGGVEMGMGKESVDDGVEVGQGGKECNFGEMKEGISNGRVGCGEKLSSMARRTRQRVKFGGVKEGVRVLEIENSVLSAAQFNSSTFLADIRRLAVFDLVGNSHRLTVLKSQLSAFYDAKYGYSLPIQSEPISIEDAMDEQGSLVGLKGQEADQNGPQTPLNMPEEQRKLKTIAELLGDGLETNNVDRTGETPVAKSAVKSRKKRHKVSDADQVTGIECSVVEVLVGKTRRRKRKTIGESQSVADNSRVTRSRAQKKEGSARSITSVDTADHGEIPNQQTIDTVPRVRKKVIDLSINADPRVEAGYERISPREKKLSKYLSPPYTNILERQRSSSSLLGSDQPGGHLVKCTAEKSYKSSGLRHEKTEHLDHNTKPDLNLEVNDPVKAVGSLNGVLREIRSAARNPLYIKRDKFFDSLKRFLSSYRSLKYKIGPNYKSFKKRAKNLSGTKQRLKGKVARSTTNPKQRLASKVEDENYRVPSLSNGKKVDVQKKKKKKIKSSKTTEAANSDSEPLAIVCIKQKLGSMIAMLAQTDGKMTLEIKSKLESEAKELLKKVKMMNAVSS